MTPPAAGATNTHTATPGRQALSRANAAYVARDWAAALGAFREAQQHSAERVEATLGVGFVMAQQNNAEGALTAFREAVSLTAGQDALALDRVRALQSVSMQYEAIGRWSDALAGWQAFVTYAQAHPTVANPAIGQARVLAVQAREQRERLDGQVRTRIEERRARNATPPAATAP